MNLLLPFALVNAMSHPVHPGISEIKNTVGEPPWHALTAFDWQIGQELVQERMSFCVHI